jgi:hypothetical protein
LSAISASRVRSAGSIARYWIALRVPCGPRGQPLHAAHALALQLVDQLPGRAIGLEHAQGDRMA